MKNHWLIPALAVILSLSGAAGLNAEDEESIITDEEALFGESSEDEELFSDTIMVDMTEEAEETESDTLLSEESVDIGGRISLSTTTAADFADFWGASTDLELEADVYIDARPDDDFRVFLKGSLAYPFEPEDAVLEEIFTDFHIADRVYFRAGKHTVSWGVGYFFSPADIINLTLIDPEEPDEVRTGPVSLKTQVPFGPHNGYLYLLLDEWYESSAPALAPKLEFVIAGLELGIGGYYHYQAPPAGMLTFTFPTGDFTFFGEVMGRYGSDKTFIQTSSDFLAYPLGYEPVLYEETFFFSATAGLLYSHLDDENKFNFTLAGQYYYNGEGYDDTSLITDNPEAVSFLLASEELTVGDLIYPGKHYGAALVSWNGMLDSDFSTSLFWLGSFSDLSGRVTATLSYRVTDYFSLSLGLLQTYGSDGTEFTPDGPGTYLTFEATLGKGRF